ncbi:hypothetical protein YQE_07796, partial [Dendroctonus ponderosae]
TENFKLLLALIRTLELLQGKKRQQVKQGQEIVNSLVQDEGENTELLHLIASLLQLLVSGQPTTNSGSSPASGGGSLSPGGSAGLPGALSPGGTSSTGPAQCCDNGRPLMTDPVTGQSVCSCQYDSARLALQYPRSVGMYGTPYPSTDQNPYPSIGVESSAFYSP